MQVYKFRYKDVEIIVKKGDITEEDVEAIVNPANSWMRMGAGVSLAIKRKGGVEIEIEARKYAPVLVGSAVTTTAGRLKAKYVIHAPTMEEPGMRIGVDNVHKAAQAALREARRQGISSIAFPALGAGVGGVPVEDSVRAIIEEIKAAIDSGLKLREIRLVAWTDEDLEKFLKVARELLEEAT